jgi:hypothetical protein
MNHRTSDIQELDKAHQNKSAADADTQETTSQKTSPVSREEAARRIREYRRIGFEKRAPAVIVYQTSHLFCPWPGCGCKIAGIDFQLDKMGDPQLTDRLQTAWWQGPGLVGRCPKCGQYVLFGMAEKISVSDPSALESARLPEDWAGIAHLVPKPVS